VTDRKLEQMVGKLLRAGVSLAAAVVLVGGDWYLAVSGATPVDYRHFYPRAHRWLSLGTRPPAEVTIQVGLLLLIATPIARVAFALVAFALERDRLYVFFTLAVLLVLLFSLGTSWL
jgi:uncharacterized membrane protein